ncbi:MAG TPA: hypothetical protein VMT52_19260 [Planctomycetota bacterium]|nr:hypothetical protein [Planctomycetota bacterium]
MTASLTQHSTQHQGGALASAVIRIRGGAPRARIPVSVGIPFPRGLVAGIDSLRILDAESRPLPCQWKVLSSWPGGDGVRWLLADFVATAPGDRDAELRVVPAEAAGAPSFEPLELVETAGEIRIDTGAAVFTLSRNPLRITARLPDPRSAGLMTLSVELAPLHEDPVEPALDDVMVETRGPVRATIRARGRIESSKEKWRLDVEARLGFFAGLGTVKLELRVRNPRAARHAGGLWDLGDPGSVLFEDLTVRAAVEGGSPSAVSWTLGPGQPVERSSVPRFDLYQESSGGENWMSRVHVNRSGVVPHSVRGYVLRADGREAAGLRAEPVVSLSRGALRVTAAVERFWQEFPRAIEVEEGAIHLRLFPRRYGDPFELQGGEQKTHVAYLSLEAASAGGPMSLGWVHSPLEAHVAPEWFTAAQAFPGASPCSPMPGGEAASRYLELIESSVAGKTSFFEKREVIDEYGWRHHGEVYADHENQHADATPPIVSHYNNQYDLVFGFLNQFQRTGDRRWFELGSDLARHLIDIDVYHTEEDKAAYNGGLFWHTDHYVHAYRSTHRTYSRDSSRCRTGRPYGGGPSNEHNYATGLLLYHFLTGSVPARETVLGLADWVLRMDDGGRSPIGALVPLPTGFASSTYSHSYHGPGRGAGNSISVLVDAFLLSEDRAYLEKAEELMRRVIHPRDDISRRELEDRERRWSYVVFLQALGKYLDLKAERGERDFSFEYARESLLAYARWMLENEVSAMQILDRVQFPTETWPAHDVRKSAVFECAARWSSSSERDRFLEKAKEFFEGCIRGVLSFETAGQTRPLAILLQSGASLGAWRSASLPLEPPPREVFDFGEPARFEPQKEALKRLIRSPSGIAKLAARFLRPSTALHLARGLLRGRATRRKR